MERFAGTSGYSYTEWRGSFYPEQQMLSYYAERLSAVESNNTYYRMPMPSVLQNWAGQVPEVFRCIIKTSRQITHFARLTNVGDWYLLNTTQVLGSKLREILFQLPGSLKNSVERLKAFLDLLPARTKGAFEFCHDSWIDDDVHSLLQGHKCAMCMADTDDEPLEELTGTISWGYLRLRRQQYKDAEVKLRLERAASQDWDQVYVFLKT